jgi:hypothetical protein
MKEGIIVDPQLKQLIEDKTKRYRQKRPVSI